MKRLYLIVAALLVCAVASAQVGIVVGATSSSPKIKDFKATNVTGLCCGLSYRQPVGLGFMVQPSLLYNSKGAKVESYEGIPGLKSTTGYAELLLQVQFGLDLVFFRPYTFIEPFAGYALTNCLMTEGADNVRNRWDGVDRFEYGLSTGFGMDISSNIQICLKYFWNFEDPSGGGGVWTYVNQATEAFKDRRSYDGLTVTVGYFF